MGEQVFGAGDKLKWIEQIVRDLGCTGFDVRVAVEISRRTNTGAGEATVSQSTIANCLGKSPRWVRQSFKNLRERGHGETIIPRGYGPGRPSTFRPLIRPDIRPEHRNDPSGVEPEHRNDPSGVEPEHRNDPSGVDPEHRKDCAGSPEGLCTNIGSYTSSISTTKIPTEIPYARARDRRFVMWGQIRQVLSDELGGDVFGAWFGKVALAGIESGVVTLWTPTRFVASYLEKNFQGLTLQAWRRCEPTVVAVRFDHRVAPIADGEAPTPIVREGQS